jgi:hypothetical protein
VDVAAVEATLMPLPDGAPAEDIRRYGVALKEAGQRAGAGK